MKSAFIAISLAIALAGCQTTNYKSASNQTTNYKSASKTPGACPLLKFKAGDEVHMKMDTTEYIVIGPAKLGCYRYDIKEDKLYGKRKRGVREDDLIQVY